MTCDTGQGIDHECARLQAGCSQRKIHTVSAFCHVRTMHPRALARERCERDAPIGIQSPVGRNKHGEAVMAERKGEHRTAQLKRKPGRRANQQASVASAATARKKERPQVSNDSHGERKGKQ